MQTLYGMNASGISTGETRQIDDQEGIEPGWVPAEPPALAAGEAAIWAATQWLVTPELPPDVDGAKSSQTARVSAACQAAIVAGFTSSALGAAYTYPAKPTDQQNLNASVVASLLPGISSDWTTPFWCATQPTDGSDPVWAYLPHTVAQIQQVGTDGKTAILACLTKNQQLAAQIDACTTVEAVQAITWS